MSNSIQIQFLKSPERWSKNAKKYIMIRQPLDKLFNITQWKQICFHVPEYYKKLQNKIKQYLISNQELFQKYFVLFYQNHSKIYHWCLLARDRHFEMNQYLNRELLSKTIDSYRDEMKFVQSQFASEKEREKQNKTRKKQRQQIKLIQEVKQYKIDDLSNQIFNFMANKALTASLVVWQKPWSRSRKHGRENSEDKSCQIQNHNIQSEQRLNRMPVNVKNKNDLMKQVNNKFLRHHDFHQLYIQTFHACDGPRYIFYDYEKHMRGLSEKDKYNMFIRGNSTSKTNKNNNKFLDFRLTQMQDYPIFKEIKSCDVNRNQTSYQYFPFGNAVDENFKKKTNKVVFRRKKKGSRGKFVRK